MAQSDVDMLRHIHSMWRATQPEEPANRRERRAKKARLKKLNKQKLRQADMTRTKKQG